MNDAAPGDRRLPAVLLVIGSLLLVAALVLVINRVGFTAQRTVAQSDGSGIVWTVHRREHHELTLLWCATLAGVLGVGMVLIGCARWPAR